MKGAAEWTAGLNGYRRAQFGTRGANDDGCGLRPAQAGKSRRPAWRLYFTSGSAMKLASGPATVTRWVAFW